MCVYRVRDILYSSADKYESKFLVTFKKYTSEYTERIRLIAISSTFLVPPYRASSVLGIIIVRYD